jgi:hypothetical protein
MDDLKKDTEYDPEGAEEFVTLIRQLRKNVAHALFSNQRSAASVVGQDVILRPIDNRPGFSVSMDPQSTNLNENRVALWGRGFCPAAGLPPGVVWEGEGSGKRRAPGFQG